MESRKFIDYFWHYPRTVITDIGHQSLVFEDETFFQETEKHLCSVFKSEEECRSHFAAFHAYLRNDIAVGTICDKVNFVMKEMHNAISAGRCRLDATTKYEFSGKAAIEALEGIFTAFHDTSVKKRHQGRFDVDGTPLSYAKDNLILRLTYYKGQGPHRRLFGIEPAIDHEEIIESSKIDRVSGDSETLLISLLEGEAVLEMSPFSARWLRRSIPH